MRFAPPALAICFLLLHLSTGWRLLDESCLLNPDSIEYVLGARGLALGVGYRDLSDPKLPVLSRPIGTSLVLAPVAAARGLDVVACKFLLLVLGTAALGVFYGVIRALDGPWPAAVMVGLLSTSPVTLDHDTQVLSEIPFLLYSLLILRLLARAPTRQPVEWWRLVAVVLLTVLAEKTRSLGIFLWPALVAWGLARPDRGRIVSMVLIAFAFSLLGGRWVGSDSSAAGYYQMHLRGMLRNESSWAIRLSSAVGHYLQTPAGLVWPAFWPDALRVLPVDLPPQPGPVPALTGMALVVACLVGLAKRLREDQAQNEAVFVLVNLVGTAGMLLIWPRMSRLAYPALFFVLVYAIHALWTTRARPLVAGLASLLLAIHLVIVAKMWTIPPPVWDAVTQANAAGKWIREHTPSWTRLLVDQKYLVVPSQRFLLDVGSTNQLGGSQYQLNQAVLESGARIARLGTFVYDPFIHFNLIYRFEPVGEAEGAIALWQIEPNRTGTVAGGRADLKRRIERLEEQNDEARSIPHSEELLREQLAKTPRYSLATTVYWLRLGDTLLRQGRAAEAIDCFRQARGGQSADIMNDAIADSLRIAEQYQRAEDPGLSAAERGEMFGRLAMGHAAMARWDQALACADRVVALDPSRSDAHLFRAQVLRTIGEPAAARAAAEEAAGWMAKKIFDRDRRHREDTFRDLFELCLMIDGPAILRGTAGRAVNLDGASEVIDPNRPASYLRLDEIFHGHDLDGVCVDLLEMGTRRLPDAGPIRARLAERWAQFGRFDLAVAAAEQSGLLNASFELRGRYDAWRAILENPPRL